MVVAMAAMATQKPFLLITARLEDADNAQDDLELFAGCSCSLFPAWETLPGEGAAAGEIEAERLKLCSQLAFQSAAVAAPPLIVASIQALQQPVPTTEELQRNTLQLAVGQWSEQADARTPERVVSWAIDRGFERLDLVESPGDVACRGDIVDIFAPGENQPFRVQFFDDRIESIRRFDISTHRSIERLNAVSISAVPRREWGASAGTTDLFAYLPADTIVVLDGPGEVQETGQTFHRRLGFSEQLFAAEQVLRRASEFCQLHLTRFASLSLRNEDRFHFDVTSLLRFEGGASEALATLCDAAEDHKVYVFCDNEGEKRRLAEMIGEHLRSAEMPFDPFASIELHVGVMHRGFEWRSGRTIVLGHHEIFHRHRQRRRLRKVHAGRPIDSWLDLNPGDLVVHVVHGIGIYRGLKKMEKVESGQVEEFLTIEYAEGARVHVPTSQIELVQKYVGAAGIKPQLSKLGGKRWSKTKQQVAAAVSDLAEQLLRVQAARSESEGIAYPAATEWQREFEASFLYEETEDQLIVAGEISQDLTGVRPMDRLVCGDVGYGKTELAMRAAFRVVEYGRQAAVLVPTTVLAEQHYLTFKERMVDYPFVVERLSRFCRPGEQRKIIERVKKGQVDIVIGTHRLLSKDVAFADLGLVVIDEEQRFGVEHKERFKAIREMVDVLTLSATPIPRTLHMSMVGLRDISTLQTPPVDRRSIATQVCPFSRELIRNAIIRELNRDGQVYFVHNSVKTIAAMADTVRSIVPEARVVYGHGQMKSSELENVMHHFLRRQADVLVATTIIESGIDIPTVNTIFINDADRFGLADLHQLRGRVGRSSHKAYCYLLLPKDRSIDRPAAKRLKAIEQFSELGAGFRIAVRDLEIRGAGNLLGREQSGHIANVGYEMYCQLLDRAVRRLKNEPDPTPPSVQIDLDVMAHIPRHYIPSERSRIDVYRRITMARTVADLNQLEVDLADVFGPVPPSLERLLELAEIRVHARTMGIRSISRRPPDVVFVVESMARAEPLFEGASGTVRMADEKTVHLRLPPHYLEPSTLLRILRNMFHRTASSREFAS
jgi:transcription-repair coupling factor (superfamily II helicase)